MPSVEDVDEYLAALPGPQLEVLGHLRQTIRAAAPDAEETVSYRMPAFRQDGKFLVSYAGFKDHCSLFPASGLMLEELGAELGPYVSGKGTLRFGTDDPLPDDLVTRIVRVRLREVAPS